MAKFGIAGDTSGVITVQGPSVAGTNTLTWPAETGTAYLSTSTTALPGQIAWNTTVQTTGFTAVAYGGYFCNTTSAAFTVTLPLSPTRGQFVVIVDYAGTSATNNITVSGNGANLNGSTGNILIKTNRQGLTLTYIDSTQGWLASSNVYSGNPPFGQQYTASYLVVAGGGGGGSRIGGGGGAGGVLSGTLTLQPGTVYTAVVGGGAAGQAQTPAGNKGSSGSNSTFPGVTTALGGGGGTGFNQGAAVTGGSGGGGGSGENPATPAAGAAGTPGQGNGGGTGAGPLWAGGGGGGAGAVGGNGTSGTVGGAGGAGLASSITGLSVIYGGGGGANADSTGGLGGPGTPGVSGGNGTSGSGGTSPAFNGVANTGGGGGGLGTAAPSTSSGGSGVVIIAVPTANYTGTTTGSPTITTSGSNTIIKWATAGSGTYTA